MKFIKHQINVCVKEKNYITGGTIRNYYKAGKLFCVMNDIVLNWDRLARGLPKQKTNADDRPPKLEEIQNLLKYPDKRIKPIVLTMLSSGIRIGVWDELKWKHVTPVYDNKNILVAAKLLVYPGDTEEYFTFITPEAYYSLKEWIDFRKQAGEKITKDSWIMRDLWQTSNTKNKSNEKLILEKIKNPTRLKHTGIKSLIERGLYAQNCYSFTKRNSKKGVQGSTRFSKVL
ncbi:MAG: hypothetical protein ACPKPY_09590 [Nitrososphaeraceae archaeon]